MSGRILVIKLGALGDFAQALGPMAAIRRHHAGDRITLLTGAPFADFARAAPYFDEVAVDVRPKATDIGGWLALRAWLRHGGFDRVYDLQTSGRTGRYFRLFWPGPYPEWSGVARGCSHPHANPDRDRMHTIERQAEQLRMAGIDDIPPLPDLSWVETDTTRLGLPARYALIVPGGAPSRPGKRWPAERYGQVAARLAERGIVPVILGAKAESEAAAAIAAACPEAIDLVGRTDFRDLAAIARTAACAVGNDTGPMHMIAFAGCPSLVLYSEESDPALCGQRGPKVEILRVPALDRLAAEPVADKLLTLAAGVSNP